MLMLCWLLLVVAGGILNSLSRPFIYLNTTKD